MANPAVVSLTSNTWVKVAENVTNGVISIKSWQPSDYLYDNRDTGETAPTDDTTAIGLRSWQLAIQNTVAIDVYIKCVGKNGSVIVDL